MGTSCWRVYKERQGQRLHTYLVWSALRFAQSLRQILFQPQRVCVTSLLKVWRPLFDLDTQLLCLVFPQSVNPWQQQHEWSIRDGLQYILYLWETMDPQTHSSLVFIPDGSTTHHFSCSLNPLNLFHFCSGVQNKLFSQWVMIAVAPLMFWYKKWYPYGGGLYKVW